MEEKLNEKYDADPVMMDLSLRNEVSVSECI